MPHLINAFFVCDARMNALPTARRLALAMLAAIGFGMHASAQEVSKSVETLQKPVSSMAEAATQVQNQSGGKVLSIRRMKYKGQMNFRVKVLTEDSRVRVVLVPEAKAQAPATSAKSESDD